jgi:hypothetical protein
VVFPAVEKVIIEKLLQSEEPSIRLRTCVQVLGQLIGSSSNAKIQEHIRRSERVQALLSNRKKGVLPYHPYAKWCGSHWVLSSLADLYYPRGDKSLIPLREQVYEWLSSKSHLQYVKKRETYAGPVIRIHALFRAHASMEGNALYYLSALGLADDRTKALADRLVEWQWPDGGWNCDKSTTAHTSSFTESLLPLRGLAAFEKVAGKSYKDSIERAAEFFLERKLFRKKRDGRIINAKFLKLHYPCYWHYDILFGLKVMVEAGFGNDERCSEALSILKSKALGDGGFPAEEAYYRISGPKTASGLSPVRWGGVSSKRMNEFVTCDALSVFRACNA